MAQNIYNETQRIWKCFKIRMFLSGVKRLLRTTGVQIPTQIFWLPHEPPLGPPMALTKNCIDF
jgi:hypothetical protein